jgi:hypothetical protein
MPAACKAIRLNLTGNSSNMLIAGDCRVHHTGMLPDGRPQRKQRACWGLGGLKWRQSGFVISADMRYPASEAGYQPPLGTCSVSRHVVCLGRCAISHYDGQTLSKRGRLLRDKFRLTCACRRLDSRRCCPHWYLPPKYLLILLALLFNSKSRWLVK